MARKTRPSVVWQPPFAMEELESRLGQQTQNDVCMLMALRAYLRDMSVQRWEFDEVRCGVRVGNNIETLRGALAKCDPDEPFQAKLPLPARCTCAVVFLR